MDKTKNNFRRVPFAMKAGVLTFASLTMGGCAIYGNSYGGGVSAA